jgi:hypothetical protein
MNKTFVYKLFTAKVPFFGKNSTELTTADIEKCERVAKNQPSTTIITAEDHGSKNAFFSYEDHGSFINVIIDLYLLDNATR